MSLLGGAIGGAAGLVGGLINGIQARRQQKLLEQQARAGVAGAEKEATQTGKNVAASAEYQAVQNLFRDFYGMAPLGEGDSYYVGDESFTYDAKTLQPASKLGTVGRSTLEENLRKSFIQAQTARGIYDSNIAASAEASGLNVWRTEKALEIAPAFLALGERPTTAMQTDWSRALQKNLAYSTGGKLGLNNASTPTSYEDPFAAAFQGLVGGALQGAALGTQIQSSQQNAPINWDRAKQLGLI